MLKAENELEKDIIQKIRKLPEIQKIGVLSLHSAGSELVFLEFKLSILARLQPFVSSFTFLD